MRTGRGAAAAAAMVATASKQSRPPPWGGDSWKWSETENQSKPASSAKRQSRPSSAIGPPRCPTWIPNVMLMAAPSSSGDVDPGLELVQEGDARGDLHKLDPGCRGRPEDGGEAPAEDDLPGAAVDDHPVAVAGGADAGQDGDEGEGQRDHAPAQRDLPGGDAGQGEGAEADADRGHAPAGPAGAGQDQRAVRPPLSP